MDSVFPARANGSGIVTWDFVLFLQSHAGLFNLCVVVLVAVNSRLIIENLMKVSGFSMAVILLCWFFFITMLLDYKCLCCLRIGYALFFEICLSFFVCVGMVWRVSKRRLIIPTPGVTLTR